MKKCPKCKAEIEENSRFCLYCMTSFEEKQIIETKKKNRRWLYIIAALLAFLFLGFLVFLFSQNENSAKASKSSSKEAVASRDVSDNKEQSSEFENGKSSDLSSNKTPDSSKNEDDTDNKISGNTSDNKVSNAPQNTLPSNNTSSGTTSKKPSSSNKTEENSGSGSSGPIDLTSATYYYRDAKYGDDFLVSANLENAVVITGVKTPSADGKYEIPETLSGKRVIAIMPLAFCDNSVSNTVRTVVVPSSVKTIWNDAFATCYNLTDIYFKGNSVYTESQAFAQSSKRSGTLTIHCSAGCSDRNYRYYKNSASYYDAKYQEWNG